MATESSAPAQPNTIDIYDGEGEPFSPHKLFDGAWVPNCLLSYRGLTPGAKLCWTRLSRFAGKDLECWPSLTLLCEEIGVSERSARGYLTELEQAGFIKVIQRGLQQTNKYQILKHRIFIESLLSKKGISSGPDLTVPADQEVTTSADPTYKSEMCQDEMRQDASADRKPSEEISHASFQTFHLVWSQTRGLKRLSSGERDKARERWIHVQITEDELREALKRFVGWVKSSDGIRSPLAVFLKDPNSWGTLRTIPKEQPRTPSANGASQTDSRFVGSETKEPAGETLPAEPETVKSFLLTCEPRFRHLAGMFLLSGVEVKLPALKRAYKTWLAMTEEQREQTIVHADKMLHSKNPQYVSAIDRYLAEQPWTAVQIARMIPTVQSNGRPDPREESHRIIQEKMAQQATRRA